MLKRHWLIASLVVVAIALFAAFQFKGNDKPQYFTTKVDRGDIREVVEATGTINAVTTVQVGSQVSGTISRLNADFNSRVKKGQVVAQIDPSLFEGALLQARADLANAKANLVASQANLEKAKATALQTRADYERTAGLAKQGVMSQQQLIWRKPTRIRLMRLFPQRRQPSPRRRPRCSRSRQRLQSPKPISTTPRFMRRSMGQ